MNFADHDSKSESGSDGSRPDAIDRAADQTRVPGVLSRLSRIVFWVVTIFGSLITFPAAIHWMFAGWLCVAAFQLVRKRAAWPAVLTGCVLLTVKQPGWTLPLFGILGAGILFAGIAIIKKRKSHTEKRPGNEAVWLRSQWVWVFVLSLLTIRYSVSRWADADCGRLPVLSPATLPMNHGAPQPIVCLGDSLTSYGYPDVLRDRINIPIVDFGRDGFSTEDAIKNLLPEIEAIRPQTIVVELGGHDYKDGRSRAETKANLIGIIERSRAVGAEVVLVEIPRGFVTDPYAGLERELSAEYDLQLVSDSAIRKFIFWGPYFPPGSWVSEDSRLSEDGLHPNERGNELFADYVEDALVKLYGPTILKKH
jgi:lysophospholipase L1-like esterase